ncbi:MAG: hypothetical protein PHE84_15895 [bacterium]|nr:hypothetical protein [bacterium]
MKKLPLLICSLVIGCALAWVVSARGKEAPAPKFQSLGASGGYKDVVWILEEGRYLRFCESNRVIANWGVDCSNALDLVSHKLVPDSNYPIWPNSKEPITIPRE